MLVTDVKKALKSVATTCDGDDAGECHVIFTKHGGTIVNVSDMGGIYTVGRLGCTLARVANPLRVSSGRSQLHKLRVHKPARNHC